jgi:hypothetical protein
VSLPNDFEKMLKPFFHIYNRFSAEITAFIQDGLTPIFPMRQPILRIVVVDLHEPEPGNASNNQGPSCEEH